MSPVEIGVPDRFMVPCPKSVVMAVYYISVIEILAYLGRRQNPTFFKSHLFKG